MALDLKVVDPSESLVDSSNEVLKTALDGNHSEWTSFLASNVTVDGIDSIFCCDLKELLQCVLDAKGKQSLDWLLEVASEKQKNLSSAKLVLLELWLSLKRKVTGLLESRLRDLPDDGYLLYFTEGISWCIVFSYRFAGAAANIKIVHYIKEPRSVYDIFALAHMNDEHTRTIIKSVVRTRSKIIVHRNVLIDVDRYTEGNVFGPTIDTIYIHEFLVRVLNGDKSCNVKSALEIGCGNGLLVAGLANKCKKLNLLIGIDSEIESIVCTTRNVKRASIYNSSFSFYGILGRFDNIFNRKFDLVVSNPPYLPYKEEDITGAENSQRTAIKGTELIAEMVQSSQKLLSNSGVMVIVYSELSEEELLKNIPDEMRFISANNRNGFKVLFDLEEVMRNQKWLDFLIERGLECDPANNIYHHYLKIGVIVHKDRNTKSSSFLEEVISKW